MNAKEIKKNVFPQINKISIRKFRWPVKGKRTWEGRDRQQGSGQREVVDRGGDSDWKVQK